MTDAKVMYNAIKGAVFETCSFCQERMGITPDYDGQTIDCCVWKNSECGFVKYIEIAKKYREKYEKSGTDRDATREQTARITAMTDENKRLREALEEAVAMYGKPGGPWNVPGDTGGWLYRARKALEAGK